MDFIRPEIEARVWAYMGGIARNVAHIVYEGNHMGAYVYYCTEHTTYVLE